MKQQSKQIQPLHFLIPTSNQALSPPAPIPSPPSPSDSKVYWFECIGMFIFVFLQSCTKQPTGIHLQITFILMIAIPMCATISGAHYNPAVTLSNYMCRFYGRKDGLQGIWMYFKAQIYTATFALALAYIINDGFLAGLALPLGNVTAFRLFLSEMISTGILVFWTQLTANPQTSFAQSPGQRYCFIIAFVFVARKTAYISSFAINPAITIATVVMDVVTCQYKYVHICSWYIIGDFVGAALGTWAYNGFYVPVLFYSRKEKEIIRARIRDTELQPIASVDSNREQQSLSYSRNFLELQKSFPHIR